MNTTLKTKYLAAALECAAKKDIRYYLNGVCLDFVNATEVIYCSSDGHLLFAAKDTLEEPCSISTGFQLIIPSEVIKTAIKDFKNLSEIPLVHLHAEIAQGAWRLGNTIFQAIDGKFPDYTLVIPKEVNGELSQFHPELLVRCNKAIVLATGYLPKLFHNGTGAAVIQPKANSHNEAPIDNVLCVCMPLREADGDFSIWVQPEALQDTKLTA